MTVRLTETAINRAIRETVESGKRRDLADAGCPGLRLRLTPSGAATWVLSCRDGEGRMRRFPLGGWPSLGISESRTAARALHVRVKHHGADPVAERRRDRAIGEATRAGVGTLKALLDLYQQDGKPGARLKSWKAQRQAIENVFAAALSRPLATMNAAHLQMAADGHKAEFAASLAVRCLRPIVKWAAAPGRGYAPAGLAEIRQPATVHRRSRVLLIDELRSLLPILSASRRPYGDAMKFMLLTLARREEVGAACWRRVDLDTGIWTITETKNGEPHAVPLSQQAMELLRARLPTGADGKPGQPNPDALIFATSSGARLLNWDRETKAIHAASCTAGWTRHDLRRTGATMLGEMGIEPHIIEGALNHASIHSPLASTYNRSRYRPQVAEALQRLADRLDEIENGGSNVIPPRPASR